MSSEEKYAAELRSIFSDAQFLPCLRAIRECATKYGLTDWWLAGGAVRNTVWKKMYGDDCLLGIKDFDIAFFDRQSGREVEAQARAFLTGQFPELIFDVKNQASFGVWRDWHFVFESCEDGIAHWLHTATAVGLKLSAEGRGDSLEDQIEIFAPYGLSDLFTGVICATPYNRSSNGPCEAASKKAQSFLAKCPRLNLVD